METPKPGQVCQCCGLVVPSMVRRLRAGRKHPETAHAAAEVASVRLSDRSAFVLEYLASRGTLGATDDEVDAATGWGHQCTTPVMNALRNSRRIAWAFCDDGSPFKRKTRKGNHARVNVLAKYAVHEEKPQ